MRFTALTILCSIATYSMALPLGPLQSSPPPPTSPNPAGELGGTPFKYCKRSSIRYDPAKFVCHDNQVICPILDAGSPQERPMKRCGEGCYDAADTV